MAGFSAFGVGWAAAGGFVAGIGRKLSPADAGREEGREAGREAGRLSSAAWRTLKPDAALFSDSGDCGSGGNSSVPPCNLRCCSPKV